MTGTRQSREARGVRGNFRFGLFLRVVAAWAGILVASAAAGDDWLTNYEAAMTAAREHGRPVLTVFTGSDWCPHCRTLEEKVLHTETFRDWADDRVVLLMIDLPQQGISAEERAVRSRVCIKYGVRTFPSAVLIGPDGAKITAQTGYVGQPADAWVAALDGHLPARDPVAGPTVASREDPAMRLTSGSGLPRR